MKRIFNDNTISYKSLGLYFAIESLLENGEEVYIDGEWDIMIAHPPCTFLAVSGAKWYYHPGDKNLPIEQRRPHPSFPNRAKDREEAAFYRTTG